MVIFFFFLFFSFIRLLYCVVRDPVYGKALSVHYSCEGWFLLQVLFIWIMLEQLCILSCKWKQSSEISLLMFMEIPVSCFMNHVVSAVKLINFIETQNFFIGIYMLFHECQFYLNQMTGFASLSANCISLIHILDSQSDTSSATCDIVRVAREQVLFAV